MPDLSSEEKAKKFLAGAVPAFVVFWLVLFFYGKFLSPQSFELLPKSIREQHIISLLFRADTWHFPLSITKNIAAPQGYSLALGDSIPLFAIVFKALGLKTVQYFGIWLLISSTLTIFFAYRITRRIFKKAPLPTGMGTLLFALAPFAWYHPYYVPWAAGQWLTLWGLSLFFQKRRTLSNEWYGVVIFSCFVHPYFVLTSLFMAVADIFRLYLHKHKVSVVQAATFFSNIFTVICLAAAASGVFYAQTFADALAPLTPFTPAYFLKAPIPSSYSASYFYPGLGILLGLLPTPAIALFQPSAKHIHRFRPLIFCFTIFFLLSLGGGFLVGGINSPVKLGQWFDQRFWPIFTSGPRFMLPIMWTLPILVLQNLAWLEKSGQKALSLFLLAAALILQISQFHMVLPEPEKTFAPLEERFAEFARDRGEIVWIHNDQNYRSIPYFEEFAYFAVKEGKLLSSAPSARIGSGYRLTLRENRVRFFAKEFNTNAVYVLSPENVTADLSRRGRVVRMNDVFLFKTK